MTFLLPGFPQCLICIHTLPPISNATSYMVSSQMHAVHLCLCLCLLLYHIMYRTVCSHAHLTKYWTGKDPSAIYLCVLGAYHSIQPGVRAQGPLVEWMTARWKRQGTVLKRSHQELGTYPGRVGRARGFLGTSASVWLQCPTRVSSGHCCVTSWRPHSFTSKLSLTVHTFKTVELI